MKISTNLRLPAFICGMALAASTSVFSQDDVCKSIAQSVANAVEKEPGKVLMMVEDALIMNDKCACEIIQAAITASKADPSLVNQIVQTAISVAPKMSGVIMDCATSVSPGAQLTTQVTAVASSGKEAKNPMPASVAPAVEEEFSPVPSSIRGIYLMQPPAGGFLPRDPNPRPCDKECVSPTHSHPYYP